MSKTYSYKAQPPKAGFLSLGALTLGSVESWLWRAVLAHCRMCSSICDLYPSDASSTPWLLQLGMSADIAIYALGGKITSS